MVKVLFSLGDWSIRCDDEFRYTINAYRAYHFHAGHATPYRVSMDLAHRITLSCGKCGEPVPDEIQGLLYMTHSGLPRLH